MCLLLQARSISVSPTVSHPIAALPWRLQGGDCTARGSVLPAHRYSRFAVQLRCLLDNDRPRWSSRCVYQYDPPDSFASHI